MSDMYSDEQGKLARVTLVLKDALYRIQFPDNRSILSGQPREGAEQMQLVFNQSLDQILHLDPSSMRRRLREEFKARPRQFTMRVAPVLADVINLLGARAELLNRALRTAAVKKEGETEAVLDQIVKESFNVKTNKSVLLAAFLQKLGVKLSEAEYRAFRSQFKRYWDEYKKKNKITESVGNTVTKDKMEVYIDKEFINWAVRSAADDARTDMVAEPVAESKAPPADNAQNGGIDLNSVDQGLQVNSSGEAVRFNVDPVKLQEYRNAAGLEPVILNVQPFKDAPTFFGLSDADSVASPAA
jgi:hypothetical protein